MMIQFTPLPDGVNKIFTRNLRLTPLKDNVYLNGQLMVLGTDYIFTTDDGILTDDIEFKEPPQKGDEITSTWRWRI